MLKGVHHVCFAVYDMDESIKKVVQKYGLSLHKRILLEKRNIEAALFITGNSYIELLAPINKESNLMLFLNEHGEGFHHIAYEVESIEDFIRNSEENAVSVIRKSSVGDWTIADLSDSYYPEINIQIAER